MLQFLFAAFLLISIIAPVSIFFAIVPLVGLLAFRSVDLTLLKAHALLQTLSVLFIVGLSNSTLFDSIQAGGCEGRFDKDDLCKDGWETYVSLCLFWYYLFVMAEIVGTLFVYSQAKRGGKGGEPSATDPLVTPF